MCRQFQPVWNPFIFRNWECPVVYQEVDTIALETHSSRVLLTPLQVPIIIFVYISFIHKLRSCVMFTLRLKWDVYKVIILHQSMCCVCALCMSTQNIRCFFVNKLTAIFLALWAKTSWQFLLVSANKLGQNSIWPSHINLKSCLLFSF